MTTKSLKHLLEEWIPQQRWFTGSGHVPRLQRIGTVRMGDVVDPQGRTVALSTVYVADRATVPATIYQVPLTVRSAVDADEKVTGGHLGQVPLASMGLSDDPDELGTVHDAAHDPAYAAAIMAMAQRETSWGEDPVRMKGIQLKARRPHKPPYIVTGSRVLPPRPPVQHIHHRHHARRTPQRPAAGDRHHQAVPRRADRRQPGRRAAAGAGQAGVHLHPHAPGLGGGRLARPGDR